MVTVLRPLSTSELLDRTFHLYKNNFLVFVGIAAIPQLFVLCLQLAIRFKPDPAHIALMLVESAALWVAVVVAALIAHAATAVAVSDLHLDQGASISTAFSVVKSSIPRVIGIALVVIFVPVLIAAPVGLVVAVLLGLAGGLAGGGMGTVAVIGIASLLTPLIIVLVGLRWWLMWSLVVPVTVLERTGLRATLRRSKELTKGRRLGILGVYVLIVLLGLVVAWLIQAPLLLVTGLRALRDPSAISTGARVISALGGFASSSLVGGLATIALTLIYYDQRVRKEGFDLQLMMSTMQPALEPPPLSAVAPLNP